MTDSNPIRRLRRCAIALLAATAIHALPAQAVTIDANSSLQKSQMVSGTYSAVESFNVTQPGTLTIRLENISWPERLSLLNCSIYSQTGFMHALTDSATLSFDVAAAGTYFANLSAGAGGLLNLGLFSFKVSFVPSAPTVPVPAAVWLLGSVLGLFGFRRRALPALQLLFRRTQCV
jgi:hypothetical protein